MEEMRFFEQLIQHWSLGSLIRPPQPVSGGYMHKMFRLDTACGSYAVKLLNPEVMKRPEALGNYLRADALEGVLEQNGLPIVAALSLNGRKLHTIDGQFYYLFPWVNHRALPWEAITEQHCSIIGGLLARLHGLPYDEALDAKPAGEALEAFAFDWQELLSRAQECCPALAGSLSDAMPLLIKAQATYNDAVQALPPIRCICNADMDSKNVLWQGDQPLVIDLECLEINNPINDLVQLALSWSGGVLCQLDWNRLQAFLTAYQQASHLPPMDWQRITGLGFAWLDWLHYNLRRAVGLEGSLQEEKQMGVDQAMDTLERIRYYGKVQQRVAALFGCLLA